MASPQNPDGPFVPVFNEFYGTDEERVARDKARLELKEVRSRHRALQPPRTALTEHDVKSALADIGIDL